MIRTEAWNPPRAQETRPRRRDRELRELGALASGGILLVAEAVEAGWPPRLLNRRLHTGGWQRVHQGAWAAPGRAGGLADPRLGRAEAAAAAGL